MKNGFYTALGTPLDNNDNLVADSFVKQIKDQTAAGASGLLIMGSMGIGPYVKNSEFAKVAKVGTDAAKGACTVFVGVMDNSVTRVLERIDALKGMKIDGVVATTPYYFMVNQDEIYNYFAQIADQSAFPVYLYDLPGVTKVAISVKTVESLMKHKNIKGIKSGNLVTARLLSQNPGRPSDFSVLYSGLDTFDIAYQGGIKMNLDGMFACTPKITSSMYKCLANSEWEQAGKYLDDILTLRDCLAANNIMESFGYVMNLLGCEGRYSPDYRAELKDAQRETVMECLKKCKVL